MEGMALFMIIGLVIAIGMYYGLGENLEVSSRMLTRELKDAERVQKTRIVTNHANKAQISDTDFEKATKSINRIDSLDI